MSEFEKRETSPGASRPDSPRVTGTCTVLFAFDIGFSVNLDAAERRLTLEVARETFRHKRRAPAYFTYRPAPLRVSATIEPIRVTDTWVTQPSTECVVFDFGAVSVALQIPFDVPLRDLRSLSDGLYENTALLQAARAALDRVVGAIATSISRPHVTEFVEDYCVYEIRTIDPAPEGDEALAAFIEANRQVLAQILRAETCELSEEQVRKSLSRRISFGPDDATLIDWNASVLFDRDAEDTRTVLEFANVELLELRYVDDRLDAALEQSYEMLIREDWRQKWLPGLQGSQLKRIAELQMDSAMLFEGVNNALKLLGDQHLARVYRLAAERLHLPEWDETILRKLATLESVYQKLTDYQSTRRMEMLEWIIIILIAAGFVPMLF